MTQPDEQFVVEVAEGPAWDPVRWVDVTDRFISIEADVGRNTELERAEVGTAKIEFDNTDGGFTPGRGWALVFRQNFIVPGEPVGLPGPEQWKYVYTEDAQVWVCTTLGVDKPVEVEKFTHGGLRFSQESEDDNVSNPLYIIGPLSTTHVPGTTITAEYPVTPGERYRATWVFRSDPEETLSVGVAIKMLVNGSVETIAERSVPTTGRWQTVTLEAEAPEGATAVALWLYHEWVITNFSGTRSMDIRSVDFERASETAGLLIPGAGIRAYTRVDGNHLHYALVRPPSPRDPSPRWRAIHEDGTVEVGASGGGLTGTAPQHHFVLTCEHGEQMGQGHGFRGGYEADVIHVSAGDVVDLYGEVLIPAGYLDDTFDRVDSDGFWGYFDAVKFATSSTWEVNGDLGVITHREGTASWTGLVLDSLNPDRRSTDWDVRVRFRIDVSSITGGALEPTVMLRYRHDTGHYYMCRLVLGTGASHEIRIFRVTNVETDLTGAVPVGDSIGAYTGQWLWLRASVYRSPDGRARLRVKAWEDGQQEPGWHATYYDGVANMLPAGGHGIRFGRASGNTNNDPVMEVSHYLVRGPGEGWATGATLALADQDLTIPPMVVTDQFARTDGSSWGSTPSGYAWTTSGASATFSTDGSGIMTIGAAPAVATAMLDSALQWTDAEVRFTFLPVVSAVTGAPIAFGAVMRVSTGDGYYLRCSINTNHEFTLEFFDLGTGNSLGSATVGTWDRSRTIRYAAACVGTTLKAKVWHDGDAEPDWQLSLTDSTYSTGAVWLRGQRLAGNTNDNLELRFDDFQVKQGVVLEAFPATSPGDWQVVTAQWVADRDAALYPLARLFGSDPIGWLRNVKVRVNAPTADPEPAEVSGVFPHFRGAVERWVSADQGGPNIARAECVDALSVLTGEVLSLYRMRALEVCDRIAASGANVYYWPLDSDQPLYGGVPVRVLTAGDGEYGFDRTKVFTYTDGMDSTAFSQTGSSIATDGAVVVLRGVGVGVPTAITPDLLEVSVWFRVDEETNVPKRIIHARNLTEPGISFSVSANSGGLFMSCQPLPDVAISAFIANAYRPGVPCYVHVVVRGGREGSGAGTHIELSAVDPSGVLKTDTNDDPDNTIDLSLMDRIFLGGDFDASSNYAHNVSLGHAMLITGHTVPVGPLTELTEIVHGDSPPDSGWVQVETEHMRAVLSHKPGIALDPGLSRLIAARWNSGTERVEIVQGAAEAAGGLVLADGAGVITYHNRRRRAGEPRWLVAEYTPGAEWQLDASRIANVVTVERSTGARRTARNEESIARYGERPATFVRDVADENELLYAAQDLASLYGEGLPWSERIMVEGTTAGEDLEMLAFALGAQPSDLIRLIGLPTAAPTGQMNAVIERVSRSIWVDGSVLRRRVEVTISPAGKRSLMILDDPVASVLDAEETRLAY